MVMHVNGPAHANAEPVFAPVIGIVGHPTTPDLAWSDAQMDALRAHGFDTLQLAIAWASRPAGEVLNLEDLDDPILAREWDRRIAQARRFDFRTLAHFGLPVGPQVDATTCILDPAVQAEYARRLTALVRRFPDIDEVLIYTYDQRAWLCSEFGPCPRCRGVPLHERLPGFLEAMVDALQEGKAGVRLWWEPWELSAGQTLAVVERIRPAHLGLVLHSSIAEVQFVNTNDLWFRILARLAGERGIPVVGEGFFGGAGEDIHPLTHLACPRLVYQQLEAFRCTAGVVGVKEYYGLVPAHFSANIALFAAALRTPDAPLADLLRPIAAGYGEHAAGALLDGWELTAQAMELFPWDASWALRGIFGKAKTLDRRSVPTASWMTPAWQANRRGFYLVTDEDQQHPWLREDVGLRARLAGTTFGRAAAALREALADATTKTDDLGRQIASVERAADVSARFGNGLLGGLR